MKRQGAGALSSLYIWVFKDGADFKTNYEIGH